MDRRTVLAGSAAIALSGLPLAASAQAVRGRFEGQLTFVAGLEAGRMQLKSPYAFIDAAGNRWAVPEGVWVDGASIPRPLWSIVGGPFEGAYLNASVIHDYFCDIRVKPWQDVHRVFHEAMLANGVTPLSAKIMYLAVYYGGPRWSEVVIRNMRILQAKGASTKGGAEKVQELGELERVGTGLGMDFAVPQVTRGTRGSGAADYVITAVEKPIVDVYVFEEMKATLQGGSLSLDQIDALVERARTGA